MNRQLIAYALLSFFASVTSANPIYSTKILATGVSTPWSLNVSGQTLYYTSRETGQITALNLRTLLSEELGKLNVRAGHEAGLMGMALDPQFESNKLAYVSYSSAMGKDAINKVVRVRLSKENFGEDKVLLTLPGSTVMHNGSRVVFGSDGFLYITLGDVFNDQLPQDANSLGGKILRIGKDGEIPVDNPFGNAVWTLGHRNPQGLAVHPVTGQLWSTEHGQDTQDELNLILKGRNYGWPLCAGKDSCPMHVQNYMPAIEEFDRDVTVATSDLIFYSGKAKPEWKNDILFVTLKTGRLYRVRLSGAVVVEKEVLLNKEFGRLRDIVEDPDGHLIISTDDRLKSQILQLRLR